MDNAQDKKKKNYLCQNAGNVVCNGNKNDNT
jgi:hypothetical protein